MSTSSGHEGPRSGVHRWWWVLASLVVIAVVGVGVAVGQRDGSDRLSPESSSSNLTTTAPEGSEVPDATTPDPSPSPEATPQPTKEADEAPGAEDPAGTDPDTPGELTEEKPPAKPLPKPVKVKIDEKATLVDEVSAEIVSIDWVQAAGRGPGELSGEALRINLKLTNAGTAALDLNTTVVTLDTLEGAPASSVESDATADPLLGVLAPGKSVSGTYLFLVPQPTDQKIRISFSTTMKQPVVLFSGSPNDVAKALSDTAKTL